MRGDGRDTLKANYAEPALPERDLSYSGIEGHHFWMRYIPELSKLLNLLTVEINTFWQAGNFYRHPDCHRFIPN